jgi:MFS family permease
VGGVLTGTTMAFLPILASTKLALSATLIGIVLASRTPISLLQSWTGRFADTHNRKVQIVTGNAVTLASILMLPFCTSFTNLLIVHSLLATGMVVAQPAASAYAVEEGRVYGMATTMSLFFMGMQIGAGTGPIAVGRIIDAYDITAGFYSSAAVNLLGLVFFVWLMRRHPGKRRAHAEIVT